MQEFVARALYSVGIRYRDSIAAGRIEYRMLREQALARNPGNIAARGFKVYSQSDEDGVIEAIFERVGGNRCFLEIGVQSGHECNSHYLLLKGWRGAWAEADHASCEAIRSALGGDSFPPRFKLFEHFVDSSNIAALYADTCSFLDVEELAFLSLDIDSRDLFVLEALLAGGARPTVLCVEYNPKFPPPFNISVSRTHTGGWTGDDYYGASLQAFHELFAPAGYALVTCSLAGINAFFVLADKAAGLATFTPEQVWQPPLAQTEAFTPLQPPSMKFLRDLLAN